MAWLTLTRFRQLTIMPGEEVDNLNRRKPGFLAASIDDWQGHIMAQLLKRYEVDKIQDDDVPRCIERWIVALVTRDAYGARGYSPSSEMDENAIDGKAEKAEEQIALAADSDKGLFDLPLRASNQGKSGISRGGPLHYTETSPYDWLDRQDCMRGRYCR